MLQKKSRLAILGGKNTYTLKKAIEFSSQHEVAAWLGVSHQAVSLMVKDGREIFIEFDKNDKFISSVEIKPVGKKNVTKRNKATAR